MSPQNTRKNTKTQTEVLGYQNEVKKCHLMLHLKFDKVEVAKLDASGFQSGITGVLDLIPSGCRPFHFPLFSLQILFKNHMSSAETMYRRGMFGDRPDCGTVLRSSCPSGKQHLIFKGDFWGQT